MVLAEVYYDDGISGTSVDRRAGFSRMIADALNGRIDLIITKEVSRFARNTVDTLQYVRLLKSRNIGVIFMNDNISTLDSEGEFRLTIMASISQEESRKTSDRVKWGQKRSMEQGVVFGRDLLGYTVKNGRLYVNPEEAAIVRRIFHKYVVEEKGTYVIARELSEEGFRPKQVKRWSNTVILRVLKNEKYVGDLCQKKTITPDFLTHKKQYNCGVEEMIYLKNHHEPIIDRDMWERTQAELRRRGPSEDAKSKYSSRYWCSGKLICGECGQSFVSRTKALKNGSIYRAWRCNGAEDCSNSSVNDKVLLAAVSYCLRLVCQTNDKIAEDILSELQRVRECRECIETSNLERQISAICIKKKKAIDLALEGVIGKEDLKRQNDIYDGQLESINAQRQALERMKAENREKTDDIRACEAETERILEFGTENTELYRFMLDKIVIHNGKVLVIRLKMLPFGIKLRYRTKGRFDKFSIDFDLLDIT